MPKRLKTGGKPQPRKKARVTKLSPEQPAARDEGPRLLPLPTRTREDPVAGRLERYLSLADTAFGRSSGNTGQLTPAAAEVVGEIAESAAGMAAKIPIPEEPPPEPLPSEPEAAPAGAPARPKLDIPKPPARPSAPKPPKLSLPKPPARPSSPKPPKLSRPKPPRRPR